MLPFLPQALPPPPARTVLPEAAGLLRDSRRSSEVYTEMTAGSLTRLFLKDCLKLANYKINNRAGISFTLVLHFKGRLINTYDDRDD